MAWIRISKEDGTEEPITEAEVRRKLEGYYRDVDEVMRVVHHGTTAMTAYAYYEYRD